MISRLIASWRSNRERSRRIAAMSAEIDRNLRARKAARMNGLTYVSSYTRKARG